MVNYYSKKCLFSDRSFPILEDVCTDYFKEVDFISVDVDNPVFKTILWQHVRTLSTLTSLNILLRM